MARRTPVVVVASAARTSTGNSAALPLTDAGETLSLALSITANSGTPTLTLSVEWSMDGTNFVLGDPADQFSAIAAANTKVAKTFTIKAPWYRVVWTIGGGTPSYTFSVTQYIPR